MRILLTSLCLAAGILLSGAAQAQTPVTATCKDGTAFSGTSRSGACRGHGGVQAWDSAAPGAAATPGQTTPTPTAKPAAAPTSPAAGAPAAPAAAPAAPAPTTATPATPKPAKSATQPAATPAPGGGPGTVWVSAGSKAYHCPGTKWYGTTKKGSYMTEAEAKAKGLHPDHGKACS